MIKINKTTLSSALQLVGGAIRKNPQIPILGTIYIKTENETLLFRVSDSETQAEFKFKVEGDDSYEFCVPSQIFISTVMKAQGDDIELTYKERENESRYITLKAGRGKFKIEVIDASSFIYQDIEMNNPISIKGETFFNAIRRAFMACDRKTDLKPAFNGCGIHCESNELSIVGCHEALISRQRISVEGDFESALLSQNFSAFAGNIKYQGLINIFRNENWFGFKFENFYITTKIQSKEPISKERIDGFWDLKKPNNIMLNRIDVLESAKRISSYTNDKTFTIILEIKDDELIVEAENNDLGHSASEFIPILHSSVEDMRIGMNCTKLIVTLENLESENVHFHIIQHNKQIHIEGEGAELETQNWMIMPLNI